MKAPALDGFNLPLHYPPYRVDLWTDRDDLDREIALATDLDVAREAYRATVTKFPGRVITLRQRARVIATTRSGES